MSDTDKKETPKPEEKDQAKNKAIEPKPKKQKEPELEKTDWFFTDNLRQEPNKSGKT